MLHGRCFEEFGEHHLKSICHKLGEIWPLDISQLTHIVGVPRGPSPPTMMSMPGFETWKNRKEAKPHFLIATSLPLHVLDSDESRQYLYAATLKKVLLYPDGGKPDIAAWNKGVLAVDISSAVTESLFPCLNTLNSETRCQIVERSLKRKSLRDRDLVSKQPNKRARV